MGKLKVYYGLSRIGNVRKKRALSVMFENDAQGCRSDRGQICLRTIQDTVIERYQTDDEEKELLVNSEADKNHVSKAVREKISDTLQKAFMLSNPGYKEPCRNLSLNFE